MAVASQGASPRGRKGRREERGVQPDDAWEGFTFALAALDAVPVALFCLSSIVLGRRIASSLFVAGSVIAFAGGVGKVAWKALLALAHRGVPILARQMRYVMPLGFALMVAGAVMRLGALAGVLASLVRPPAVVALAAWAACMVAMSYMAVHNRQDVARDNWVEEVVNAVGQAALLLALLL